VTVTDQANTKAAGRRATQTVEATADPRATAIEASPTSSPDPRLRRHRPPLRRDRSGWAIPTNLARSTEVTAIADGRWSIIQRRVTTGEWSRIPCRAGPSVFVRLAARPRQVSGGVFGGLAVSMSGPKERPADQRTPTQNLTTDMRLPRTSADSARSRIHVFLRRTSASRNDRLFRDCRTTWQGRDWVSRPMSVHAAPGLAVKLDSHGSDGSLPLRP
jgi:hypothetical protein